MSTTKAAERSLWTKIRPLIIFAPLIVALWSLVRFNKGDSSLLLSFNQIHNNIFIVNDVLLAFILASYAIVFLGLCFYFWAAVTDLNTDAGPNSTIKRLNAFSLILLALVLLTLTLYLLTMGVTCLSWWSQDIHEALNIETIVWLNKYLSLGIFSIFLIADLLAWKSQKLQQKEYNKRLALTSDNVDLKHSLAKKSDQIHFSKDVTFLVNIPTVLLTGSMVLLTSYLDKADRFKGAVDHHLHFLEVRHAVQSETFQLFLNGLEAGVIVCTIIYSQIIYLILRTRWEPK